ncbi:MAG: hypothetical protein BroJett013_13680 [Alphaproteobacteria bacterium]|nr:MAG: hypothetical protein BroJett013_13680 [Alphaproteobacteria bacterium]
MIASVSYASPAGADCTLIGPLSPCCIAASAQAYTAPSRARLPAPRAALRQPMPPATWIWMGARRRKEVSRSFIQTILAPGRPP